MDAQDAKSLFTVLMGREITPPELDWYSQDSVDLNWARSLLIESSEFRARWHPNPTYRPEPAKTTLTRYPGQSVALTAIVKDEGHRLAEMLRSCAPVVDYAVINDTGSQDDTIDVAERTLLELGIEHEIIRRPFVHFSQARNEAIERVPARFNWILVFDADERLVPEDYQRFLDLLIAPTDGWRLPRYNFQDADKIAMPHPYPDFQARLFRNRPHDPIRYMGAIHECPTGAERWPTVPTSNVQHAGSAGGPHIHHMQFSTTTATRQQEKHKLYDDLTAINAEVVAQQHASAPKSIQNPEPGQPTMSTINPKDYAQITYSQCGEDIFLINNFFGDKREGFYVDVGAHHPYRLSNTALLHQRGWRGINIDVDERAINAFNEVRPRDMNILSGVASHAGLMTLHLFNEGAVNTLSDDLAEDYKKIPGREVIAQKTVKVQPLRALLDNFVPPGQDIDLMNIDVEGLDGDVLRSNDWTKYRPYALLVEIHGATIANVHDLETSRYLAEQGYQVAGCLNLTTIFRRVR